jgi:uncharacterized DUF497 family protein
LLTADQLFKFISIRKCNAKEQARYRQQFGAR